jgi:hypothetical protein
MTTEINLHDRGKPPETKTILLLTEERSLRVIHLTGHMLHPLITGNFSKEADRGGVSTERSVREGVYKKIITHLA